MPIQPPRSLLSTSFRHRVLTQAILERSTPRRVANLALAEIDRRAGHRTVRSYPVTVAVALTSACNLRCPFCVTGQRAGGRPSALFDMDDFRVLVDAVHRHAYCLQLFVEGEPTLHPLLVEFVSYASSRNLYTFTSSNATRIDRRLADSLVGAGLDHIVLAIDGADQTTYEQYRRGGVLGDALSGLRHLVAARRATGTRKPFLEWRFVVFRHNEHQIEDARALSMRLGADAFTPIASYVQDEAWMPSGRRYSNAPFSFPNQNAAGCRWPYAHLVVHADGGVSACCWCNNEPFDFGHVRDIARLGFGGLWNNAQFQLGRAVVAGDCGPFATDWRVPAVVCEMCRRGIAPTRVTAQAAEELVPVRRRALKTRPTRSEPATHNPDARRWAISPPRGPVRTLWHATRVDRKVQARFQIDAVRRATDAFKTLGHDVRGSSLLDLGCGRGHPAARLFTGQGAQAVALDRALSAESLGAGGSRDRIARRPLAAAVRLGRHLIVDRPTLRHIERTTGVPLAPERVALVTGRAGALPFADRSFDLIYSCSVFEHVGDVAGVAREMSRVLRQGGAAHLSIHHWAALNGAHLWALEESQPHQPAAVAPWDHLRDGVHQPPVYLNRLRRHDYVAAFETAPGLHVVARQWFDPIGADLLTAGLRAELSDYAVDELLHATLAITLTRSETG